MAVERKDIEIFFKIEGLEAYITDLETLDNVLTQVNTATKQVKQTTTELESATDGFDSLEQRLQAAEGATKVLAGGLEALAGAAGLLGLEDNEFFKSLEENTLSIIALSRGAIDLSEGYSLLRKNTQLAKVATEAFNFVAKQNPYVLLATAIIAAAGALVLFKNDTEDAEKATERLNVDLQTQLNNFKSYNTAADKAIDQRRRLLESQKGELSLTEEISFINEKIALRKEDITALEEMQNKLLIGGLRTDKERVGLFGERIGLSAEEVVSEQEKFQLITAQIGETIREIEFLQVEAQIQRNNAKLAKADREEEQKDVDTISLKLKNLSELPPIQPFGSKWRDEFGEILDYFDGVRQNIEDTKQIIERTNTSITDSVSKSADTWAVSYKKAFDQTLEEPGKAADLLKRDVKAAIDFATNLNEIFTKNKDIRAKQSFDLNKALGIANAVINTAEAVTAALADKTVPTPLRIAQAIAVAAAGAAQIATISRTKFSPDSASTPDVPTPLPPSGVNNPGTTMLPGQTTGETPSSIQGGPIRAYVLVSDVNSAQQANSQIENLVKL